MVRKYAHIVTRNEPAGALGAAKPNRNLDVGFCDLSFWVSRVPETTPVLAAQVWHTNSARKNRF